MNTPLSIGVIGLGNMGQYHVKHWQDIPGATLTAIVDTNPDQLARFAAPGIHLFSSIEDLIASGTVDAVSITAPTRFHFNMAQQCLENSLHVLVEKPMTETIADAETLIAIAAAKGRVLQVGHIERFNPAAIQLMEWKKAGRLGSLTSISTERVSPMPVQITDADVILDLAVHDLDIITMITGTLPEQVSGAYTSAKLPDRADSAMLVLQYPHAIATVSVGWNSPTKRRTLTAYFEHGLVELDFIQQSAQFTPYGSERPQHVTPPTPVFPLELELTAFKSAICDRAPISVTGLDGLNALKLALCCKKS